MKNIVSIFPKCLLLLLVAGCNNNEQADTKTIKKDSTQAIAVQQVAKTSPIETVTDFEFSKIVTDTLDVACGEHYTYDSCQLKDEKFIFISNASDIAMIKINGETISLKKDESKSEQTGQESFKDVYKGGKYTVILEAAQSGSYDTGSYYTGTLQISSNSYNKTFKVRGKAGC